MGTNGIKDIFSMVEQKLSASNLTKRFNIVDEEIRVELKGVPGPPEKATSRYGKLNQNLNQLLARSGYAASISKESVPGKGGKKINVILIKKENNSRPISAVTPQAPDADRVNLYEHREIVRNLLVRYGVKALAPFRPNAHTNHLISIRDMSLEEKDRARIILLAHGYDSRKSDKLLTITGYNPVPDVDEQTLRETLASMGGTAPAPAASETPAEIPSAADSRPSEGIDGQQTEKLSAETPNVAMDDLMKEAIKQVYAVFAKKIVLMIAKDHIVVRKDAPMFLVTEGSHKVELPATSIILSQLSNEELGELLNFTQFH